MSSPVLPRFPNPPAEYSQRYMADLIRAFAVYQQQMLNPGEGRNTTTVLTALASSDQGLEPGTLFRDGDGYVRVALEDSACVGGLSATGGVGQITKAP